MAFLFVVELWAFLGSTVQTGVILDANTDTLLRINFNVTMLDLPCEYAAVDVVDVIGTNKMNVTKNVRNSAVINFGRPTPSTRRVISAQVQKWATNSLGERLQYKGRNKEQKQIKHEDHEMSIEEMHMDGVHAAALDKETLPHFLEENEWAFVNFYAPWCIWCQRLEPTWERLAETVAAFDHQESHASLKVGIAKVDVPGNMEVGTTQGIRAFPTMRLFKKGEAAADYREDRTVEALLNWLKQKVDFEARTREWEKSHGAQFHGDVEEHPGCMLSGFVLVNRVPGNFHIEARSAHHEINAALANVSHVVNHLSFGAPVPPKLARRVERKYPSFSRGSALDGRGFINDKAHEAAHHYVKVVSTHFDVGSFLSSLSADLCGNQTVCRASAASMAWRSTR